jgi:cell pole-organizing protein PopZ
MFEPDPEPLFEPDPEPEPTPSFAAPADDDILELTDDMVAEEEDHSFMNDIPEVREPQPTMAMHDFHVEEEEEDDTDSILAAPVQEASTTALAELVRAVSRDRNVGVSRPGLTLEDLTRELLRPLVKDWLDQNLPFMIERLVKKEIEKMVNRAEKL